MKTKYFIPAADLSTLVAGCNGAYTPPDPVPDPTPDPVTATFNVLSEWSDGVGVGKGNDSEGNKAYFISPYIVDVVAEANQTETPPSDIDPESFPVMESLNGYDFREGFWEGANVIVAVPQSGNGGELVYLYDADYELIMAGISKLNGVPTGIFSYYGVYAVGLRYSDWREVGVVSLDANFSEETFVINGQSTDTSLTGVGSIDTSTGQISGSGFQFSDVYLGDYSASIVGGFGGDSASDVAGVFYTNDFNHDFVGAFAGKREE